MDSPLLDVNQLCFAVLPYVAAVTCVVLLVARRYRVPPFRPPASAPAAGARYAERLLFGYGVLVIVAGHVLAFLIPQQVLAWNNNPVRLYVLEVSALAFALMTLVGLFLTVVRCLASAEARRTVGPADWVLYVLLLVQVASGVSVALLYPWGSSWYATSAVPYLRSVLRLEPDLNYISAMPHLVKLHVVGAYALLAFLPLTRVLQPFMVRRSEELVTPGPTAGSRVTTMILLVGLTASVLALGSRLHAVYLPGNQQGYEPVQPIAFSHRLHAGEMGMSCFYCHSNAEKGPHAGIASASVCMNCHRSVTAPLGDIRAEIEKAKEEKRPPRTPTAPELAKLYTALALNDKLDPDPARAPHAVHWVKVHNLPAFVRFDHRAHIGAGVECQRCHGAVETMERVRQVEDLSMGWCVNCHRDANRSGVAGKPVRASNDCTTCHY
jgi:respiratory nitrate reductase gamma subunit